MPTYSGTYLFHMSAQQLVTAALNKTGAFDEYEIIPPTDLNNVLFQLELMVKEMALDGMPRGAFRTLHFRQSLGRRLITCRQSLARHFPCGFLTSILSIRREIP